MIMNSFSNALIMNISSPSFANQKSQLEDIINFTKYYKTTLENNGFNLNGLGNNGKEILNNWFEFVYDSLIEELTNLKKLTNLDNLNLFDLLNNEESVKIYNLMDALFPSSIRELLTTGNVLNEDNQEYTTIAVIFYKMADGEIHTITKMPC